eukprot:665223-Prymnesium_polylepis.1
MSSKDEATSKTKPRTSTDPQAAAIEAARQAAGATLERALGDAARHLEPLERAIGDASRHMEPLERVIGDAARRMEHGLQHVLNNMLDTDHGHENER